jgi:hypothetical protein
LLPRFNNNTAFVGGGGANFVAMSQVIISNSQFVSNRALNDTLPDNFAYSTSRLERRARAGGCIWPERASC